MTPSSADVRAAVTTLAGLTKTPPAEALLTLRAHSFRAARSLHDVADDISTGHPPSAIGETLELCHAPPCRSG